MTSATPAERPRCEIWWARARLGEDRLEVLPLDERRRAARLAAGPARAAYVTGRALARLLLAVRAGVPAPDIALDTTCRRCGGDHGKPRLADAALRPSLSFNLAHGGGWVVAAVTDGWEVGVDLEPETARAPHQLAAVAEEALCPVELGAFERLDAAARGRALVVAWARKEAVLKATGDGLSVPPRCLGLVERPGGPVVARHPEGLFDRWGGTAAVQLRDLASPEGTAAALCVLGPATPVVAHRWAEPLLATSAPASRLR